MSELEPSSKVQLMISPGSEGLAVRSRLYEGVIVKTSRCVPPNIVIEVHHCPLTSEITRKKTDYIPEGYPRLRCQKGSREK